MSSPVHMLRRPTAVVVLSLVVALVATLSAYPPPSRCRTPTPADPRRIPPRRHLQRRPPDRGRRSTPRPTPCRRRLHLPDLRPRPPARRVDQTAGTASGNTITLTVGKPTKLGLPTGVAMPAFGSTKIVITPSTNTLTATATATGTAPATLSVQISHANTSTLPSSDLTARLSLTASPLGANVTLAGAVTDVNGAPSVSLTGTLPAADTVTANVVTIAKGAAITATTPGGLQLNGRLPSARARIPPRSPSPAPSPTRPPGRSRRARRRPPSRGRRSRRSPTHPSSPARSATPPATSRST